MRFWKNFGLTILIIFLFLGCKQDESDDDDKSYNDRLQGDYISIMIDTSNDAEAYGTAYYDGSGSGTYTLDGTITENGSFSYLVSATGQVTGKTDTLTLSGVSAPDGSIAVYSGQSTYKFHLKESTDLTNADISGDYIALILNTREKINGWGTTTFDGSGQGTFDYHFPSPGSDTTGDFQYGVKSNGKIDVTSDDAGGSPDSTVTWYGIANSDGSIMVAVGNELLEIHLKKSSSAADSLLSGTFLGLYFDASNDSDGVGTITYDGTGAGAYAYGDSDTGTFTYNINPNGSTDGIWNSQSWNGGVKADGKMAVWVGQGLIDVQLEQ